MKNSNRHIAFIKITIAAFIFLAMPHFLIAQNTYKLVAGPDVLIKVSGSSNVHDWTMASSVMENQGIFKFEGETLTELYSFNFSLAAKSLKSGHASMDNRTYKSMKADQYPRISYKLNTAVITPAQKNKYLIKAKGELTIAGTTQPVNMDVTAVVNSNNTINCSGSVKLQLTDYNIKPPSYMLGAMKVANDLTIQFNLIYKKQSKLLSSTIN